MEPAERLDDYLDSPDDWQERRNEAWRVTDLGSADWVMRKVAKLDKESESISDAADMEIEAIESWRQTEHERISRQREHWTWLLADFHEKQLAEDPKAKTIRLPHGALVARKQPDNIDYDPDTLLALFAADSEYVRVKRELDRSAIKHAVLKDGEVIPGVEIVPGEIRYSVAPN